MPYNYATKYESEISDILRQESLTGILETDSVNWTGAKTFVEKTLKVSGYKPHTRTLGWNTGNVQDDEIPYTLEFDRDIQFFIDQADVDETSNALSSENVVGGNSLGFRELSLAGKTTAAFMRQQAIPEIDAYRFSKIATKAIAESQSAVETINKTNIYALLKKAFLPIRKYGASNMITYLSSESMGALEESTDFSRGVSTEKIGNIETRVASIDGVKLIEVWDFERFKTEFDFTEGFKAAPGTKDINFMVVAKPSIIAKVKISSIYVFPEGTHTEGDGWLYQNRIYHDLFVKELSKDGIYVSTKS